ncbi:KAP P-loop domain protein [Arcobacter nitrofigilis DSM 7299]|uniref:KAP P-loop domain protein n=1 Tax=Arcobacter nitrofigilis (strain ATCC 33309 / DSM 7299 / CCUG 15893 / LMG 7604 / NCTC 12251 / CI) TaxID=572480 RepID=D5V379_ARCNC|nr:KAP P-loop domain-containing protein [Arcobacter nitrofigilis]ADG92661.1 KAP P-loop domain protein [Arcobacter nitrofigilis DSM 7299]
MWADNETTEDFLNYDIHCNLIKEYVTNPNLLPLTIGVFGDWGSGKSSIMKMLEQKLENEPRILTIYFNSWLFESYEDAKVSLLENILLELSKNETLSETAKKKVLSLISRVDYMKFAKDGISKYGKNILDIVSTGGVGTAIEIGINSLTTKLSNISTADASGLNDYIKKEQNDVTKNSIKTFRKDFQELITATDYDSVVIFVDDLDRCMPERVIDTLEAIKLFLSVPNTAFIIGADERIIKHSISMHLNLHTFNNDSEYLHASQQIVTDYIEKLIQIPYRIPKLSPSEIESYNNLLFSSSLLDAADFKKVYEVYLEFRVSDFYSPFSFGNIKDSVSLDEKPELNNLLNISHFMSQMITNVLKGNPRQTKRFLNTFILRQKLAKVANLDIDIFILIKLMLLEYLNPILFKKLNELQSPDTGLINELMLLESIFIDEEKNTLGDAFQEWQTPQIQNWIKVNPRIGEIDLRNYFWLVRDKTDSTLSNIHMVSPIIQKLYALIINTDKHQRSLGFVELSKLDNEIHLEVFNLLKTELYNNPSKTSNLVVSLFDFIEKIENEYFANETIIIFSEINFSLIKGERIVVSILKYIKTKYKKFLPTVDSLILSFSEKQPSILQKTAKKEIKD